ncbi:MAG: dihydrolipoamide acetyltransferase family protein [Sterolibacterium sp.]
MPQLAMGMSEGTIVEWSVQEGDRVTRDQTMAAIETEKVVTDLPAPYAGFVHLLAPKGETLPVENVIAKIADTQGEYQSLVGGDKVVVGGSADSPTKAALASTTLAVSRSVTNIVGKGKVRASGLAKAIARKNGINLSVITGSGPAGRIVRRDVDDAMSAASSRTADVPSGAASVAQGMREKFKLPLTGMRATIAQRMLATKTSSAQTYVFFEIDITKLLAARATILGYQSDLDGRMSLAPFQARALALACQQVPICNATLTDNAVTLWENVNVGIAVGIPGRNEYESGLVVPVVRDVQDKGVLQIHREMKDLVARARSSSLSAADMADGTITLSSTDGFLPGGWMLSTPLLNLPQVISFQPGTPIEKPVVIDGQVAVRTILPCGLTFDHRALDGVPAGKLAKALRDLLSNPELMLL